LLHLRAHVAGPNPFALLVARELSGNEDKPFRLDTDDMGIEHPPADAALVE
jgi:hypothetical protein